MNLTELQREAHAIAKAHGWWDEERTFGDLIALVHSELSEALEWYRTWGGVRLGSNPPESMTNDLGQPIGVASELADVVIRVADMAEHYDWALEVDDDPCSVPFANSFGSWVAELHYRVATAYATYPANTSWCLSRVVALVQEMAAHYGIDLDAAIEAKMEYNRTRPYRHGGKAL